MSVVKEFEMRPIQKQLDSVLERRMARAALAVVGNAKRLTNTGQPIRRSKSGALVGLNPSSPNNPPHKLSGQLHESIRHVVFRKARKIIGRIGTNMEYGRRIELGFTGVDKLGRNVDQAPRPFLRPALKMSIGAIRRALGG